MGWTLNEVRALDEDEFVELVEWAHDLNRDDDSINADDIVEAKRNKDADAG